jgi:hypothetical protein
MTPGWIFTFGFGHVHPLTGENLIGRFVRIGGTETQAHTAMCVLFGQKWAGRYKDEEAAGVHEYGLRELPIDDLAEHLLQGARTAIAYLLHASAKHRFAETHPEWRRLATGWLDVESVTFVGEPGKLGQMVLALLDEVEQLRGEVDRFSREKDPR